MILYDCNGTIPVELRLIPFRDKYDKYLPEDFEDKFIPYYFDHMYEFCVLKKETIDVLEKLKGKYKMAVLSNGHSISQHSKIRKVEIEKYFDEVLVSGDIGIDKPDKAIFEYMADKLGRTKVNAFVASSIIAICYLLSTGYTAFKGPIYPVDNSIAGAFWTFNSVIVIAFLVFYSRLMLSLIGDYENKLKDAALIDKLTGLYNRHYMMEKLEKTVYDSGPKFVTMIDIDDFKKINDRYGHNAGDYIHINVARIMREVCKDCDISRWGGEEFLIYSSGNLRAKGLPMFETLRQRVESEDFVFGEEHIKVTITSGMAEYTSDSSVDKWVNAADDNLYTGKKTGKNKVVY